MYESETISICNHSRICFDACEFFLAFHAQVRVAIDGHFIGEQ